MKLKIANAQPSLSRVNPPKRKPTRVALVQMHWQENRQQHLATLADGIAQAASSGAKIVFLPELTLSRYMADTLPNAAPDETAEDLENGPSLTFAKEQAAKHKVFVHISLFQKQIREDGLGLNVAVLVSPSGQLIARTPKLHIPITAGYYEDKYFAKGPATPDPYPVYRVSLGDTEVTMGLPTCWDEWFPEVARNYSLGGAELLCYPTAIGSEPDHPDFDTEPLWRQVIVGNAISNGLFMVVPNRWGNEGKVSFYGSSFICDPYGRVLVQADREGDEVLVADLDLDQRQDWLDLFPFLETRRPDTYQALVEPNE